MPLPIRAVFDTLNAMQVDDLLRAAVPLDYDENRAFVEGDHWQNGGAWTGPVPSPNDPNTPHVMEEIRRGFVSHNIINELCDRHEAGVMSREPSWGFAVRRAVSDEAPLTPDEESLIAEAEAILTAHWDRRKLHNLLQSATKALCWSRRVLLRAYVPRGLREEVETESGRIGGLRQLPIADAVDYIHVGMPSPAQAIVHTDPDTMQDVGVYVWNESAGSAADALSGANQNGSLFGAAPGQSHIEVSYLDSAGDTLIREVPRTSVLVNGGGSPLMGSVQQQPFVLDGGGQITLFEMTREPLITPQVRQQQKLANMALSMLGRNVVLGGFLERVIFNGQPPGTWSEMPDPARPGATKRIFDPAPFVTGPARTNFVNGIEFTNSKTGEKQITSPSMLRFEPVDVKTFVDTFMQALWCAYASAGQLHVLITDDATTSGVSRQQALADFILSLLRTRPKVEAAGRWLLEIVLAMAATFAGTPGRFNSLRATFDCRIDPGPATPDEMRLTLDLVKEKIISQREGMSRLGIDDVDAEIGRLKADWEEFNRERIYEEIKAGIGIGIPLLYQLRETFNWTDKQIQTLETARETARAIAAKEAEEAAKNARENAPAPSPEPQSQPQPAPSPAPQPVPAG